MMSKSILLGAARSIDLFGGLGLGQHWHSRYVDARAHWSDWRAVGEDLHYAIVSFRPSDSEDSAEQLNLFENASSDDR